MNWKEFSADPYKFVDELNIWFRGNNLNLFQKYQKIQKIALYGAIVFLGCWIAFGFDSTPLQFVHVLEEGIMAQFTGKAVDLLAVYNSYYGKEMHYSAFVIYFLLYYFMSKSWERVGITKSKNMVFSFAVMFGAIACFEWFWILSYGIFQNQPWVYTWKFPQMKILLQNTIFSLAGGLTVLYMLTERWFWNGREQLGRAYYFDAKNWKLWLLIAVSVAAALLWIFYPFHVQQISVSLENGEIWQSSRMFPQTLYTVDLNPADADNSGVWFWVENNWIHGWNTVVKILMAASAYMLFKVKRNP